METPIVLPDLGAVGESIRVSAWLVNEGDTIEFGDRVVEVLVPGMTFDVSAPTAGVLARIEQPVDSVIAAGDILGWIQPAVDTDTIPESDS